jgi:hypothetical protein
VAISDDIDPLEQSSGHPSKDLWQSLPERVNRGLDLHTSQYKTCTRLRLGSEIFYSANRDLARDVQTLVRVIGREYTGSDIIDVQNALQEISR